MYVLTYLFVSSSDCAVASASKQCQDDHFAAEFWTKTLEALKLNEFDPFGNHDPVF